VYAIIAAVLTSVVALLDKKILFRKHAMEFAAVIAIMNAIVGVVVALVAGARYDFPAFSYSFMVLVALIASAAFLYTAKAVRHMPVSISSPLFALGPALTAIVAFLFLRESLTVVNTMGLFFVIVGVYLLEHSVGVSVIKNFKVMFKQKYFHYIIIALLLYAVSSTIDRYVLGTLKVDVLAYLSIVQVLIAIFFTIMVWYFHDLHDISKGLRELWLPLFLIAFLTVGYRYAQNFALSLADGKVALVTSIKRSSTLLTTLGGSFFHEKHLLRNFFSALVIITGVLMVIL